MPLHPSLQTETVVRLPPIEVWQAFIQPVHLFYWLGEAIEIDPRVGGAYIVRASNGIRLDTTVERLLEGRRLVLRPTRRGDDARIEIDLVKLSGAETRVRVADPESGDEDRWREALENLRSVWERGVDLRDARRSGDAEPPPGPDALLRKIREATSEEDGELTRATAGLSDADAYRHAGPEGTSVARVLAQRSIAERTLLCRLDDTTRGERPSESDPCCDESRMAAVLARRPTVRDLHDRIQRDGRETLDYLEHAAPRVAAFKPRWGRLAFTALDHRARGGEYVERIARIRSAIAV